MMARRFCCRAVCRCWGRVLLNARALAERPFLRQTGHAGMARMTLMIQSGHCVIGLSQAEMILVIAAQATMALRARFSILISRYGMGATMRRSSIVAIALVSTAAFVQIAAAADLPMKVPPPPPP